MPRLGVIPETGPFDYDWYARQVKNINRRRPQSAHVSWSNSVKDDPPKEQNGEVKVSQPESNKLTNSRTNSNEKARLDTTLRHDSKRKNSKTPLRRREPKPDYYGLDNSMKKLTISKPRKWRPKERNESKKAWSSPRDSDKQGKKAENVYEQDDDDKASVMSVDRNVLRKTRAAYSKFKYPSKYHYGLTSRQIELEENVPSCLRKYPRYSNQAVRQDCKYNPLRSVTHLNVHSIKSGNLPHPSPDGKTVKRRRPTSAPPRSISSYPNNLGSSFNSIRSKGSFASHKSSSSKQESEADRNGSYQFVYDEDDVIEEEGPTHVTLEVQDSDDDEDADRNTYTRGETPRDAAFGKADVEEDNYSDRFGTSSPQPAPSRLEFTRMDSDNAYSEELEIRDDTRRYSDAEYPSSESDHSVYKGHYPDRDTDSAKSVEYEPDFT